MQNRAKFLPFALIYESSLTKKQRNKPINKQTKKQVTQILMNSFYPKNADHQIENYTKIEAIYFEYLCQNNFWGFGVGGQTVAPSLVDLQLQPPLLSFSYNLLIKLK